MFENLKEDYKRYGKKPPSIARYLCKTTTNAGFRAVMLYRIGRWCRLNRLGPLAAILERIMHHACHCWISTFAEIGPGLMVAHVCGLVVGGSTRLGKNCDIRQNVTFGGNFNKIDADGRSQPWVGDNVSVGAGAVIVGPVKIGSNSIIGANSVVTRDVPENVIVMGVPAQIIKKRWDEATGRML
jgi:serine O-acetyltransferase